MTIPTYRELLAGAYKCLIGDRVSSVVEESRLAICTDCPRSQLGMFQLGAVLQCQECRCLLGFAGPGTMVRVGLLATRETKEARTRAALSPICKVTVRGEACPLGKWGAQQVVAAVT